MPTLLGADAILGAAANELALHTYVTEDLRSRFRTFIGYFNALGPIDEADYPRACRQMEEFVGKRLQLARDWARQPQILAEPIEQPFFVIGHPRSGTTVLEHLLGLDEGHRLPRYWEVRHPSPPPGADPAADARSIAAETAHVEELIRIAPVLLQAHPFLDQGGRAEAECEDLMTLDFHMIHTLHFTRVPSVPYPIMPADGAAAFAFHKKLLQQFQWKTPTRRWLCKGTTHQYNLPALWSVYPDAVCLWAHRAPEEYFASFFRMIDILYRPINGHLFREIDVRGIIAQLKRAYDHVLDSEWIADPRICHIRFKDLMQDAVQTIRRVYEAHDICFTPAFEARIRRWIDDPAHRSDRYGKFEYSLRQCGLTVADIRRDFAAYYDRFGL
jgi:hypothetical protein